MLKYATHLNNLNTYFNKGILYTNFKYINFLMFNIFIIVLKILLNNVNNNLKFVDCGVVPTGNVTSGVIGVPLDNVVAKGVGLIGVGADFLVE